MEKLLIYYISIHSIASVVGAIIIARSIRWANTDKEDRGPGIVEKICNELVGDRFAAYSPQNDISKKMEGKVEEFNFQIEEDES